MRQMYDLKQIKKLIEDGSLIEIKKYLKANPEASEDSPTLETIKINDIIYVIAQPHTDAEVKSLAKEEVESATSGTIQDALGLNSEGKLVKGSISGGIKLYRHHYTFGGGSYNLYIITPKSTDMSSIIINAGNNFPADIISAYAGASSYLGVVLCFYTNTANPSRPTGCMWIDHQSASPYMSGYGNISDMTLVDITEL